MKPTFAKMGLKVNNTIKTITIGEQEIEVKQYLPINDKLELISNVINKSLDDINDFYNPVQIEVFTKLEMLYYYTNITFTDKQKEDPAKLYDLCESNNIFEAILNLIPEEELNMIWDGAEDCIKAIYAYQNSIYGILERVSTDYANTNLDLDILKEKVNNLGDVGFLHDVVTKLG